MHATDIVAYTYQAETLCPGCVATLFNAINANTGLGDSVEDVLDWAADIRGIDRTDETSFDSSEFPKVVFADQAYHCEDCRDYEYVACDGCGEPIIND